MDLEPSFFTKTDDFSDIWARNEGLQVHLGTLMKKDWYKSHNTYQVHQNNQLESIKFYNMDLQPSFLTKNTDFSQFWT